MTRSLEAISIVLFLFYLSLNVSSLALGEHWSNYISFISNPKLLIKKKKKITVKKNLRLNLDLRFWSAIWLQILVPENPVALVLSLWKLWKMQSAVLSIWIVQFLKVVWSQWKRYLFALKDQSLLFSEAKLFTYNFLLWVPFLGKCCLISCGSRSGLCSSIEFTI